MLTGTPRNPPHKVLCLGAILLVEGLEIEVQRDPRNKGNGVRSILPSRGYTFSDVLYRVARSALIALVTFIPVLASISSFVRVYFSYIPHKSVHSCMSRSRMLPPGMISMYPLFSRHCNSSMLFEHRCPSCLLRFQACPTSWSLWGEYLTFSRQRNL